MAWTKTHTTILAGFLAALATQLSNMETWAFVRAPSFWAGLCGQCAALLGAMYAGAPTSPKPKADA